MKMKQFGLIETKLFHFHRIFKGGWGVRVNLLDPPLESNTIFSALNAHIKMNYAHHFFKILYYSTIRSLYCHMVCNVPVSCKANIERNQLGVWLDSDLIAE